VFPPNFGGVTIFLFAALAPWPVFLQKAVSWTSRSHAPQEQRVSTSGRSSSCVALCKAISTSFVSLNSYWTEAETEVRSRDERDRHAAGI